MGLQARLAYRNKLRQGILALPRLLVVAAILSVPGSLCAQLKEYDVKAACLFNFVKFCDWPSEAFADASSPLVIGILGEDPFGQVLDRIVRSRVVNDRPVIIRRGTDFSELKQAHVVFICASERARAARICTALEGANVLCVGDTSETDPYTAINFSVTEGKTVFTVNLARATRAAVRVSSKLLALAKAVRGNAQKTLP